MLTAAERRHDAGGWLAFELRSDGCAAPQAFDPSRFILQRAVVPALDGDAVPLRWVDPRAPARCGPATEVRVNHELMAAGTFAPNAPFEMQWQNDGCYTTSWAINQ